MNQISYSGHLSYFSYIIYNYVIKMPPSHPTTLLSNKERNLNKGHNITTKLKSWQQKKHNSSFFKLIEIYQIVIILVKFTIIRIVINAIELLLRKSISFFSLFIENSKKLSEGLKHISKEWTINHSKHRCEGVSAN